MKLDLLNSRFDVPKSCRVFDSLEDADLSKSSVNNQRTVRMSTTQTKSRKLKAYDISIPDRQDRGTVTAHGEYVELGKNAVNSVLYGSPPAGAKSSGSVCSGSTTMMSKLHSHDVAGGNLSIEAFSTLVDQASGSLLCDPFEKARPRSLQTTVGGSFTTAKTTIFSPTLDVIKDRIHEDTSHTIAYQMEKKLLPAPSIQHSRPTALALPSSSSSSALPTPGPGAYSPKDIELSHTPTIYINPPRVIKDPSQGEIIPFKERMRRERQLQSQEKLLALVQKHANAEEVGSHGKRGRSRNPHASVADDEEDELQEDDPMNPTKLTMRSSMGQGHLNIFGSSSERFAGPLYRTESYIKTSGMILGTDYDRKYEERYVLGPKFLKGRPPTPKKDVYFEGPDVMRLLSMTAEISRSPIKYTAAFRPPSPKLSLKERLRKSPTRRHCSRSRSRSPSPLNSMTLSGIVTADNIEDDDAVLGDGTHLGPGAFFPGAAPPAIEVRNPNRPSIPFMPQKTAVSRLHGKLKAIEEAKEQAWLEERRQAEEQMKAARWNRESGRIHSMIPLHQKRK